jgi:O-antigen ligase
MVQLGPDFLGVRIGTDAGPRTTAAAGAGGRLESALFWLLLALLAAMPLPFGSARPWAWSLAAIVTGLALLSYGFGLLFGEVEQAVPLRRMRGPLLPLLLAVLWAFVQMTPLAGSELSHPLWAAAAELLGRPVSGLISVDPYATGTAVMRLFLYVAIFFMAVQLCRTAERAFLALNAIVAIAAAYALYGLVALALMPEQLLWLPRATYRGDLSPVFGGRAAYGAFAGIGLIAAIALLAKLVHRPAAAMSSRRAAILTLARTVGARLWMAAAAIVALAAAMLLTHSKGGMLATGLGAVALLCCLMTATRLGGVGRAALVGLVLGGILLTVHLVGEAMLEAGETASAGQKAALYELVRQAITDAPLLGHGYGAFESAFQSYGDGTLEGYFPNAHSDYLELGFELGLPAAGLLVLAIGAVALRCLIGVYVRRRDILYPALAVACAVVAGAQALIDYSLQIPATSALLAFILGLGYSQSWTSSDA